MLDRAHRIVNPLDFKRVVRRGGRGSGKYVLAYFEKSHRQEPRVGFIVSKSVGGAVTRNRVKRRLRSVAASILPQIRGDLVLRALPLSALATYAQLQVDVVALVERANGRATDE